MVSLTPTWEEKRKEEEEEEEAKEACVCSVCGPWLLPNCGRNSSSPETGREWEYNWRRDDFKRLLFRCDCGLVVV